MNQLACPTDISSGVGECAKMHLKMGVAGARSKVGGAEGVNESPAAGQLPTRHYTGFYVASKSLCSLYPAVPAPPRQHQDIYLVMYIMLIHSTKGLNTK